MQFIKKNFEQEDQRYVKEYSGRESEMENWVK